ncbi:hypothetical protein [Nocardia aurantia]|uniref:Uncharacterized protein n=1 Tax=Nocardia aurantia TaxID=2585199 RepID=A0A7K0DPS1_9NOCA|nr:hypothetical protein [Nocardia aurantia]MQY27578.1 hypothetical protein [Nocardia aurantia]
MAGQALRRDKLVRELTNGVAIVVGVAAACGAIGAWQHGLWPLVVLCAFLFVACVPILVRALLDELRDWALLALLVVSLPLLLFPSGRRRWSRMWTARSKAEPAAPARV